MTHYFTDNDKTQFIECGFDILNDYLFINPLSIQKPEFHENLIIHLYLIFKEQSVKHQPVADHEPDSSSLRVKVFSDICIYPLKGLLLVFLCVRL